MRSNLRFLLALSFLLAVGWIIIWMKGRPERASGPVAWGQPQGTAAQMPALLSVPSVLPQSTNGNKGPSTSELRARYQVSNTPDVISNLVRVETAVLMKNALIDTRQPLDFPIPENLRAGENPGAYIVQAKSAPTMAFQELIKNAGGQVIAYVPNNAYLIKAGRATAQSLQTESAVQSVLPYEPYYKIDSRLMKFVVDGEEMPADAWLRVTLFAGTSANALAPVVNAIGNKESSPFGEQVLIQPRAGALADIAQLGEVQIIEPWNPRVAANDLTRERLGVSVDTLTNGNHLGLTGTNIWVNVNDFGVDSNHPALQGHVFYQGTNGGVDVDGHGTHVAGMIVGQKNTAIFDKMDALPTNSMRTNYVITMDDDGNATTNFFLDGSLTNADFRGIAHEAKLFVLPIDFSPDVNQRVTDTYLIETAARTNYQTLGRTNTLISQNSWNYLSSPDYDSQAARFDAATRDALPEDQASQPVLYVFAAGNHGFSPETDGTGGEPGRIASPGTAKNVITVGALESPRFIAEGVTNVEEQVEVDEGGVMVTNKVTNVVQVFRPITDSQNQVAPYSSRGNVGISIEGAFGRFKPDLVAPGTFIWSARSAQWDLKNDFNPLDPDIKPVYDVMSNLNAVSSEYRYDSGTSFSAPGVSGLLALVQEFFSTKLKDATKHRNLSPALMKALLINGARSVNSRYDYDPRGRLNYQGWGLVDLRTILTTNLDEFEEKDWPLLLIDQSPTNAVATGEERVWNLTLDTNALALPLRFTLVWTDPPGNPQVGVKLVNDLDLIVEVYKPDGTPNGTFHGNDFLSGSVSTENRGGEDAAHRDVVNNVENIVIGDPRGFISNTFKVRVVGRRVNVKAVNDYYEVTRRTNEIVQDYALVISADNTTLTNVFQKIERVKDVSVDNGIVVMQIQNGVEATNQRVGANPPLYWTNGNRVQWNFYKFVNTNDPLGLITTAGRNVAFVTSGALNVGDPRNVEPDIDLYVSRDPLLLALDTNAVANAWKSTTHFGTEAVVFAPDDTIPGAPATERAQVYDPNRTDLGGVITNVANVGDTFYIAVKSEDQKAGEYSLIAISTDQPLEEDRDGIRIVHMYPAPAPIPDGLANLPRGRRFYGIPLRGGRVLDASVYLGIQHDELGDLVGTLGHRTTYSTLNNHSLPNGFTDPLALVYSDSFYATSPVDPNEYPPAEYVLPQIPTLTRSDGDRLLTRFAGSEAMLPWTLDMVDSAASHTGQVHQAEVHVRPVQQTLISGDFITGTVAAQSEQFYIMDVPDNAVKVTLRLTSSPANLILLVRRDQVPDTNSFDYKGVFTGTGTNLTLSFDRNSNPPLIPGEYFIALINPSATPVSFTLSVIIELDETGANQSVIGDKLVDLKDDAKTVSAVDYPLDKVVTSAAVAILSDNERVSDLTLRLTSPQGTSIILSENRGWFSPDGFGSTAVTTNTAPGQGQNLILNGGFESPVVPANAATATLPDFWDGNNVFIVNGQNGSQYPAPHSGRQFSRLDFSSSLFQSFTIPAPGEYTLRWFDSSEFNGAGRSSLYSIAVLNSGGTAVVRQFYDAVPPVLGRWAERSVGLNLAAGTYTLLFEGQAGTFAEKPMIDDVSLSTSSSVFLGPSYAVFMDDPELGLPIKFKMPPFGDSSTNRGFVFGNSFEGASFGTYPAGSNVDGWDVDTNQVVVISGGADDGMNYVNLDNGAIRRTLPTRAGRPYRLSFSYRGLPAFMRLYSRGTINTLNLPELGPVYSTGRMLDPNSVFGFHTNQPTGTVDQHYWIVNNPDPNFPTRGNQPGSELFIAETNTFPFPMWMANDTNSQWIALTPRNDNDHPGGFYTNRTMFGWFYDPSILRVTGRVAADDGVVRILVNGTNAPVAPGGRTNQWSEIFTLSNFRHGLNFIDFVVTNRDSAAALVRSSEGFRSQLSAGVELKLQVNNTNQLVVMPSSAAFMRLTGLKTNMVGLSGADEWRRYETEFVADRDDMLLQFFANASTNIPGIDIDNIVLEDTGTVFVRPEEPLGLLEGERAMGEWKLEAIDNRTGATNPAVILDWHLMLNTADAPRRAEMLRSGITYTNGINNGIIKSNSTIYTPGRLIRAETEWFYYDVCPLATSVTISMITPNFNTNAVELLVDRSGFPTGDPERDDYTIVRSAPNTSSTVSLTLTPTSPAAAPLQPGRRLFIAVRNAQIFTTNNFSLRVVGNGGCDTNGTKGLPVLEANTSLSATSFPPVPGDEGDRYQTTTIGASTVEISLADPGDLMIFASNGVEPTPTSYEVRQAISSGSATLQLPTAGTWYLRVINQGTTATPYTLTSVAPVGSNIRSVSITDDHLQVTWQSVPGTSYEIATSTDLISWQPVTTVEAVATETTYTDSEAASGAMRFIRIRPL